MKTTGADGINPTPVVFCNEAGLSVATRAAVSMQMAIRAGA
jgi:hypothetical protein